MVARRTSGVSDGFTVPFFLGVGVSEPDWPFSGVPFFFFFPFGDASLAGDFFGFGWVAASGVSFGVGDASESFVDDFLVFDFGVASGVSLGFADASDSSAGDFFAFVFFFGDGDADGEVAFFFLCGEALDLGEGVGVLSRAGDSTARAFRIGLPSSSVCCA